MRELSEQKALISAEELAALLQGKEVFHDCDSDNAGKAGKASAAIKLVDATYCPGSPYGKAEQLFTEKRIDNAVYFDIDRIADLSAPLPHTLPGKETFSQAVSALGIGNDDHVIIYDQGGLAMAASRVWWMFKIFGHDKVWVLNGGLPAWENEGFAVVNGPRPPVTPKNFSASIFRRNMLCTLADIKRISKNKNALILDARSEERFGYKPGFQGCKRTIGHIRGSQNLPFIRLIDVETGKMISNVRLETVLAAYASLDDRLVFTCGSGVTACILALGAYNVGYRDFAVYDGSWSEWSGL